MRLDDYNLGLFAYSWRGDYQRITPGRWQAFFLKTHRMYVRKAGISICSLSLEKNYEDLYCTVSISPTHEALIKKELLSKEVGALLKKIISALSNGLRGNNTEFSVIFSVDGLLVQKFKLQHLIKKANKGHTKDTLQSQYEKLFATTLRNIKKKGPKSIITDPIADHVCSIIDSQNYDDELAKVVSDVKKKIKASAKRSDPAYKIMNYMDNLPSSWQDYKRRK